MATTTTRAIVAYEPTSPVNPTFKWDPAATLSELGEDEVLVQMVATGICHTDLVVACMPGLPPRILGHEGAGRVLKIGSKVTTASVGDAVLCSFVSCSTCKNCTATPVAHPATCPLFAPLNLFGEQNRFSTSFSSSAAEKQSLAGSFFGQSSFAHLSCVKEKSIVNIQAHISSNKVKADEELKLWAPMGCGFMTGASTVVNVARAHTGSEIAVMGLGGVGLSAIMAAKIVGCGVIIAVDRVGRRLALAKELGATHVIDTSVDGVDVAAEIKKVTIGGGGASCVIDTTGVVPLLKKALDGLGVGGELILLAAMNPAAEMVLNPMDFMANVKTIRGSILGDSVPRNFIPKMIDWYREGKFPVEKLVTVFQAEEFGKAIGEMYSGETIKPVLLW